MLLLHMNSEETLISLRNSSVTTSKLLYQPPLLPSPPPPPSNFHLPNFFQPMLCSKSSNWLHRLRSSRGFPDSDHIDLDHFLSTSQNHLTDSPPPDKRPSHNKRHDDDDDDDDEAIQGHDVIGNVLSELFHMGDFEDLSRIRRKKSCRKQQCPRICVVSTNSDVQNAPVKKSKVSERSPLPLTLSSRRKAKEVSREVKVTERVGEEEEEEEKVHWDLSAYSQTEVTIIDSSVPSWKFEKILYRRKNVWKVGDKKGKGLMSSDRKKRKEIVNENGDVLKKKKKKKKKVELCSSSSKLGNAEEGGEKKKKKKKKKLNVFNASKHLDNEEALVRSESAQGHDQGMTTVAAYEKKQDNSIQLIEKSSFKKQIDGGPSVILIKSILTTNKKDVMGISKTSVKSMQK